MDPSQIEALPPDVRAAFEALRTKFRAGLADRWREIEGAADAAGRCAALHRLAGAAGGYGFDALSCAARAAERLAAGPPGAELDRALEALGRLVREAAAP